MTINETIRMKSSRYSLRTIVGFIIGLMGVLGLVLALGTSTVYRQHTLEIQRASLSSLVQIKSRDILDELGNSSRDLGLALQSNKVFQEAVQKNETEKIVQLLDRQFHQYFTSADVVKLEKIITYDAGYNFIAASTEGFTTGNPSAMVCPGLIAKARKRSGPVRLKSLKKICFVEGKPLYAVMVPVGGLIPRGYVVVITDPVFNLKEIRKALGMPIALKYPDGKVFYSSEDWPATKETRNVLIADSQLRASEEEIVLTISIAQDLKAVNISLGKTRMNIIILVSIVTLFIIFTTIFVLHKTTLSPLEKLTRQLRLLRGGREHFGVEVETGGASEIGELAEDFNAMTIELDDLYGALEKIAYIDPLTQLPNRNLFDKELQSVTGEENAESKRAFSLLLIDLDRFKSVNDTLGHHVGDLLLAAVGDRLAKTLRASDLVIRVNEETFGPIGSEAIARLGGDEFAVIVPDTGSGDGAEAVARKLLATMEAPFIVEGNTFVVRLSIGIAKYPQDGEDRYSLLRCADIAMYYAKKMRAGFAFYDLKRDGDHLRDLSLEQQLGKVITNGELELYFQPKICVETNQICGAEALVRWNHAEDGYIPPDKFIPIAEQSGLIKPLTSWVLEEALSNCAVWQKYGHDFGVSVNLSTLNLHDQDIDADIRELTLDSSVSLRQLTLELTETAMMVDPDYSLKVLHKLREMDINLSIDDFGTGYSSFAYMSRLPVNEIKIDKSFISDMPNDENSAKIVRSMIMLVHNLGLEVVAEGVENKETYTMLENLKCNIVQGYYIARPMPLGSFLSWLDDLSRKDATR